jgi:hypothetical protein
VCGGLLVGPLVSRLPLTVFNPCHKDFTVLVESGVQVECVSSEDAEEAKGVKLRFKEVIQEHADVP